MSRKYCKDNKLRTQYQTELSNEEGKFRQGIREEFLLSATFTLQAISTKAFRDVASSALESHNCLHQLVKLTPDSKISPANRTKPLRLTNEFAPILKTFYRRISEIVAIRFRPQTANTKILYMTRKNAPVFIFNSQTFTHTSSFDASSEFDDSHFNRMSGNTYMMRGKQAG